MVKFVRSMNLNFSLQKTLSSFHWKIIFFPEMFVISNAQSIIIL